MRIWWKRWVERLSSSAVPIDGDPGAWRKLRSARPGRLEAPRGTNRRLADQTIARSVWRDLQLPPPAA